MKNYRTTIAGIAALVIAGLAIYKNPESFTHPEIAGLITTGIGLILASDSKQKK